MEDKYPFDRRVENRRIEMGVLETAEDKGDRKRQIKVAITCLGKGYLSSIYLYFVYF